MLEFYIWLHALKGVCIRAVPVVLKRFWLNIGHFLVILVIYLYSQYADSNSIQCTSCQKWVHKKCSGINGSMV